MSLLNFFSESKLFQKELTALISLGETTLNINGRIEQTTRVILRELREIHLGKRHDFSHAVNWILVDNYPWPTELEFRDKLEDFRAKYLPRH